MGDGASYLRPSVAAAFGAAMFRDGLPPHLLAQEKLSGEAMPRPNLECLSLILAEYEARRYHPPGAERNLGTKQRRRTHDFVNVARGAGPAHSQQQLGRITKRSQFAD